ncbi:MAG TPA: SH3 domain-containing protein [Clostridia bacterium]|nr:SH3 domain-containing protein [Clostridia bacterium]
MNRLPVERRFFIYIIILPVVFLLTATGFTGCQGSSRETLADGAGDNSSGDGYVYGIPMDNSAGIVTAGVADVFASPDIKSVRVTQALYNQPVSVIQKENGWVKVKTVDGSSGWMKSKFLDSDISSIYGRSYTHKIIVTSKEKVILSGPSGGTTRINAPMGAEFYAFNDYDDAYEVFLPGNKTGWLKGSGLIHIKLGEMIPVTNPDDFAATALRLKGTSYLLNGLSAMGIDAPGLVYISARINGINLPRTIEGQLASGTEIGIEDTRAGDLVFLAGTGENEGGHATCVGICTGGGSYLYAGRKTGYVAVGDINRENQDGKVIAARRIFNEAD